VTYEETIAKLIEQLANAGTREAARIRSRIREIKSLQKEHDTT
jgi:hypothetical protein